MSAIAIVSSFVVSCLGIITNCSIIVLVILTKQLNSPNRILLLHLSIICLALSLVYLWLLINNSIMLSIVSSVSTESATLPSITTSTVVSWFNASASNSSTTTTSSVAVEATPTPSPDTIYDSFCCINDVFIHLLQPLSLWTISCINFDRYYAICSPLHYNTLFTTRKVTIFLCCGWIIILLTILPIYVMLLLFDDRLVMSICWFRSFDMQEEQATRSSGYNSEYYWFEVQILLTTLLTIFLPMSLIIACNVKILTIANYQRHRIASAIYESVLSAQVAITHQKNPFPPLCANLLGQPFPIAASIYPPKPNPFELRRKSQKAALVVFELIAAVVLLYSPYYLFVIVYAFVRKARHLNTLELDASGSSAAVANILISVVQFLLLCSPTVNAVLYGLKDKTIQESIHNFWRKQKTKIELHYEIQARTPSTCGSRRGSMTEITNNLPPHQPQLKRQLSEFFFGTSSSLTSHLNGEAARMYRTPSDSLFASSGGGGHHNERRRSSHHEYLSPNFDPLGKMNCSSATTQVAPTSPTTSKNILTNFKKLIGGSKSDFNLSSNGMCPSSPLVAGRSESITKEKCQHFPQILITKFSDSLLNTTQSQSTSRRDSDIQQVEIGIDSSSEERAEEHEPLLATTTQTQSLDDFLHERPLRVNVKIKTVGNVKFQTL